MAIELRQTSGVRVARGPVVLEGPFVSATAIFTGEDTGFAVRLDKGTLKEVWRKKHKVWIRSLPGDAYALDDRLYLAEGPTLKVLDVPTGRIVDEFACPAGSAHIERGGVVLLGEPDFSTRHIRAVDLTARRVVWEADLHGQIEQQFGDPCPLGVALIGSGTDVVVAKTGAHLVGISLADGSLVWGLPLSVPYIAPLGANGRMYVWSAPADPSVTRVTVDLGTGETSRERVGSSVSRHRLVIVDEATGAVIADRDLSQYGPAFRQHQEVYGGCVCRNHVLFTSKSGLMALVRMTDGELVWQHDAQQDLSPAFDDNRVYAATTRGDILVFEVRGGEL